ncbi:hypothetical protein EDD85DRAFT_539556 [Armillaria nabsnona]|nr:hypothetical protein EDD85DRAFT_539556 [Armillaria nabsnona]
MRASVVCLSWCALYTAQLKNPAFECDFPGLLQAAAECVNGSQGLSSFKVGLIASIFIITSFLDSRTRQTFTKLFPLSELPSASSIYLTFQSILTCNAIGIPCLPSASAFADYNLKLFHNRKRLSAVRTCILRQPWSGSRLFPRW